MKTSRHTIGGMIQNLPPQRIYRQLTGFPNRRRIYRDAKIGVEDESVAVYAHPDITNVVEFIKNKLYFATLNYGKKLARSNTRLQFFNIDDELIYNNFYNDFGPLNIACLYKYCCKVNKKLENPANRCKQIVHYTSQDEEKRANAAYLIAAYAVLYLKKAPKEVYKPLSVLQDFPLKPFQDASMGISIYHIHLIDFLNAIQRAASLGFFNFDDFNLIEYEKYEQMRNGDFNWVVPQKFLAFAGPSTERDTPYHPPETYIEYFLKNGVIAVVRLNKKTYDATRFTKMGIAHYDMFLPDGTVPSRRILQQFLHLAESTTGPIAVHCKAGLGRTGSLIAAYLIKHYNFSAREAIAWIRICRPGSVIGHQQTWLENMENNLVKAGQLYREKYHGDCNMILHHSRGIYSIAEGLNQQPYSERRINYVCTHGVKLSNKRSSKKYPASKTCNVPSVDKFNETRFTRILGKLKNITRATEEHSDNVDATRGKKDGTKCDRKENRPRVLTQGDRLNEIKINRNKSVVNSVLLEQDNSSPYTEIVRKTPKRR